MAIMYLKILFSKVLINLSVTTDLPSFYVEYISMLIIFRNLFKKAYVRFTSLIDPYFIWFLSELSKTFWNALTIQLPLLLFEKATQAYLKNKSIAHNKYLIPLLYLLSDCISAKSTPQILLIKDEWTFFLLKFLIICLWSPFASW